MKLNIGSNGVKGIYSDDGWVNLDIKICDNIDVVASAVCLPFKDESFDEIHCCHVLEHVTRDKQIPMLSEMFRSMKDGGKCYIEVPDTVEVCELLLKRYYQNKHEHVRLMTVSLYGKSEIPGMAHHWGYTWEYLSNQLKSCGFNKIERIKDLSRMISTHYRASPVILAEATKC